MCKPSIQKVRHITGKRLIATFGSTTNDNFMGLLEVTAEYYPFLTSHISKQGNSGSRRSSYLSASACEKPINLMAQTVLAGVIREIKKSIWYSISTDSTPDISRVECSLTDYCWFYWPRPSWTVLAFLELDVGGHTGAAWVKRVLELDHLRSIGIDITKCRSQTYDYVSNFSGLFNGVLTYIETV